MFIKTKFEDTLFCHWLENLVGTSSSFLINLFLIISAGLLYSFKIIPSPYILLIFGVISPIIFTLILYSFVRNGSGMLMNQPLPSTFLSRKGNKLLMFFDIILITGFALLIQFGFLNYFIFRFLQTLFFPFMLLIFLRVLYISKEIEKFNQGDQNDLL